MKNFIAILILSFSLVLASCASDPPPPYVFKPDNEATNPGNSDKTPNYKFADDFIYHEWKGQSPQITKIPFTVETSLYNNVEYNIRDWHHIKKLATSKYFEIWVDISEGQRAFYKATNMTDVAYDKLIRELQKHLPHISRVYGNPSDINENNKMEIIFHENTEMKEGYAGYFNEGNIRRGIQNTANMDALYINSRLYMNDSAIKNKEFISDCIDTIIHELQHDIFSHRIINKLHFVSKYSDKKWMTEALSLSTYPVIHGKGSSGRSKYFTNDTIRNGKYFFSWPDDGSIGEENYRTAANFMWWLYLQGNGDQIISDIINLDYHKVTDIDSIGKAVRNNISALKNADNATIIKTWYKANFLNEANSIYGYKGNKIYVYQANNPSGKVSLSKYCAVYTTTDMYSANYHLISQGIQMEKLKNSSGKEWLLIFNSSQNTIEVKINPNVSSVRSLSAEEEDENEWFDYIYMLD